MQPISKPSVFFGSDPFPASAVNYVDSVVKFYNVSLKAEQQCPLPMSEPFPVRIRHVQPCTAPQYQISVSGMVLQG